MGWDGMGMGWDLTPMGIGILPFPLVWVASIGVPVTDVKKIQQKMVPMLVNQHAHITISIINIVSKSIILQVQMKQ